MHLKRFFLVFILPIIIFSQEIDLNPFGSTYPTTKKRIIHSPPKSLFAGRVHYLDFITDIPKDSINMSMLFFKTDSMQYYREINIKGEQGLYRFKYDPKIYPGTSIQYYFVIKYNRMLSIL